MPHFMMLGGLILYLLPNVIQYHHLYGPKSIRYLRPTLWNSLKDLGIQFFKKKTTRLACIHNHIFYAAQFYKYLILVFSILGMLYLVF